MKCGNYFGFDKFKIFPNSSTLGWSKIKSTKNHTFPTFLDFFSPEPERLPSDTAFFNRERVPFLETPSPLSWLEALRSARDTALKPLKRIDITLSIKNNYTFATDINNNTLKISIINCNQAVSRCHVVYSR